MIDESFEEVNEDISNLADYESDKRTKYLQCIQCRDYSIESNSTNAICPSCNYYDISKVKIENVLDKSIDHDYMFIANNKTSLVCPKGASKVEKKSSLLSYAKNTMTNIFGCLTPNTLSIGQSCKGCRHISDLNYKDIASMSRPMVIHHLTIWDKDIKKNSIDQKMSNKVLKSLLENKIYQINNKNEIDQIIPKRLDEKNKCF